MFELHGLSCQAEYISLFSLGVVESNSVKSQKYLGFKISQMNFFVIVNGFDSLMYSGVNSRGKENLSVKYVFCGRKRT